jgi:23S rRNA (cytosine1962-C5)-methyltransferase
VDEELVPHAAAEDLETLAQAGTLAADVVAATAVREAVADVELDEDDEPVADEELDAAGDEDADGEADDDADDADADDADDDADSDEVAADADDAVEDGADADDDAEDDDDADGEADADDDDGDDAPAAAALPVASDRPDPAHAEHAERAARPAKAAERPRGKRKARVGPDGLPEVRLIRRGTERWKAGHPWIYQADLDSDPGLEGGEVVRVLDNRGWLLGKAFYSRASKISLRSLGDEDFAVDEEFFRTRLVQADDLRRRALPGERSYRVVHGEADGLPGLVVDRYGDYLSVQFLVPAMEQRKELITRLLVGHFKPKAVVNRSDVGVRALEGLPLEKGVIHGELPDTVHYEEGLVRLKVDLLSGQKTGSFLDQRENHVVASQYAFGEALDCFSYVGGFALQLATRAKHVTAVEISEQAAGQIRENAALNKMKNVEVVTANAFDFLRDAVDEGRKFDTIVLDPPSFAKSKDAVEGAMRGYKEINLRAMQLLRPGGFLISASCTYHVGDQAFEEMLESAAVDAKRRVQIVEKRGAGRDHPVLMRLRETRYLKCFVLRVL